MANDIPVTAHTPRGGQIQSPTVLKAWAQQEPGSVTFVALEGGEELKANQLPNGSRLGVRGGKGHVGRVTLTGGGGFKVN